MNLVQDPAGFWCEGQFYASRAPIPGDDGLHGFKTLDLWNWPGHGQWVCESNATGAALWNKIYPGNGGGSGAAGRLILGGTAIATTDWALSAGWGVNATVTAVTGNDSRGTVTVTTSVLDTPTANPTLTLTFKDGAWAAGPFPQAGMSDASTGLLSSADCSCPTTATMRITYNGTPTALLAANYILNYQNLG